MDRRFDWELLGDDGEDEAMEFCFCVCLFGGLIMGIFSLELRLWIISMVAVYNMDSRIVVAKRNSSGEELWR